MNWLLIVVCVVLLICTVDGYRKGFISVLISLASLILTIVLVQVATPYISDFLINKTPLYHNINQKIVSMLESDNNKQEMADDGENQIANESGMDSAVTGDEQNVMLDVNGNVLTTESQQEAIKNFALPVFIKNALIDNNNAEQYAKLEALDFHDYVAKYLTDTVIKVMAFFITFIIITILLRMTFFTLDIIANLPLIKGVNKIAGLGLGLVQGVLIIWLAFFAVVFFAGNDISSLLYAQIDESPFLKVLFDYNMILSYIVNKTFII